MNKKDLRLRPIEVGGKLFQSLVDACQYYDLPRALVASRLSKQLKWIVDEAFGLTPRPNSDQRKGVIYLVTHRASDKQYVGGTMTTKEKRWAGHIGNPDVSNEHGLDFAVQQFGPAAFDVIALHEECSPFQLVALEKEEIARRNTLTPNGYNLNKGGAGFISSGRKITVNGVKYASVPEACAVLTVPIFRQMESLILSQNERNAHLVNHRLRLGWTPDEAFGIVPKHYDVLNHRKAVSIVISGVEYPSLSDAYRRLRPKVAYQTVRQRLRDGWTQEQAFDVEPRNRKTEKNLDAE